MLRLVVPPPADRLVVPIARRAGTGRRRSAAVGSRSAARWWRAGGVVARPSALLRPLGRPLAAPLLAPLDVYRGRRWAGVLVDCDLVRDNRRTGKLLVPRVLRVRSVTRRSTPSACGWSAARTCTPGPRRPTALADALFAHRVADLQGPPRRARTVVVERRDAVRPRRPGPGHPRLIRARSTWRRWMSGTTSTATRSGSALLGKHVFVAGASGAGKGSLLWTPLRAIGPMIRAGLVRVSMIDLKGGAETARGRPLFHRYATTMADAIDAAHRGPRRHEGPPGRTCAHRAPASSPVIAETAVGAGHDRRDGDAHRLRRPRATSARPCGCWPRSSPRAGPA